MQDRFAVLLFAAAMAMGVHAAIETNGFYGERLSDSELAGIDLSVLDMQAFMPDQHRRVTGLDNAPVLAFCQRLKALRSPMWLRYVLVSGLTGDPEEMAAGGRLLAPLGVVERAEILPFHHTGRYKLERPGLDYSLADTSPPSDEGFGIALAIFLEAGLAAV